MTANINLTNLVPVPANLTVENVTVPALMVAIDDFVKRAFKKLGLDVEKLNSYSIFKVQLWGLYGSPEKLFVNGIDDPARRDYFYELVSNSAAQRVVEFAKERGLDYTDPETMIKYFFGKYADWFQKIVIDTIQCEEAHSVGLIHVEPYSESAEVVNKIDALFEKMRDALVVFNPARVVAYAWDIASREDAESTGHAEWINKALANIVRPQDVQFLKDCYAA